MWKQSRADRRARLHPYILGSGRAPGVKRSATRFRRTGHSAGKAFLPAAALSFVSRARYHFGRGPPMPRVSHGKAAELHELAAHAHRAAAASHDKNDHLTAHEHSQKAMEYAINAFWQSQEAHQKSEKAAGKEPKKT